MAYAKERSEKLLQCLMFWREDCCERRRLIGYTWYLYAPLCTTYIYVRSVSRYNSNYVLIASIIKY